MARSRIFVLLLLPLFFVACSDDDGGPTKPFADFDRTARFLEDSEAAPIIGDAINNEPAGRFIDQNIELDDLLNDLLALGYLGKAEKLDEAAVKAQLQERVAPRMGKAGFGGPSVEYGTYVLDGASWVLDDPSSPTDAALFVFDGADGIIYEDEFGVDHLAAGEVEYTFQLLENTETRLEVNETVDVRIALVGTPLKGVQLEHIIHLFDRTYGRQSETEYLIGIERGDNEAAGPTASATASWYGSSMTYAHAFQWAYVDAGDDVEEYQVSLQFYTPPIDGVIYAAFRERRRYPDAPAKGIYIDTYLQELGFGITSNPGVIPWVVSLEATDGVEFDSYEGEIRYRGRRVGDIEGTSNFVTCTPCDPPTSCEDIWVTWTNDTENPFLLCLISENLSLFF